MTTHKITSIIFALLFLIMLPLGSGIFRIIFLLAGIWVVAVTVYNHFYMNYIRKQDGKPARKFSWEEIFPALWMASILSVYFALTNSAARVFLVGISAALLYFFEVVIVEDSEQGNFMRTLLTYFGLAIGATALNFYLLPNSFYVLLSVFFMTFLVCEASFAEMPVPQARKDFYSVLLAFACLQVAWALLFLPLHFTVMGIMLFNVFYLLWIITYYYLYNTLSTKKIYFHIIFFTIISIIVLLSTPWKLS